MELLEWQVKQVEWVGSYILLLTFADGKVKRVDLAAYLNKPIFEPLNDIDYFKQVSVEGSSVAWPNGADFAPEFLYSIGQELKQKEQRT